MNRKLFTLSVATAALAFGAGTALADTTVIGGSGQSTGQGANSTQSGLNGDGGAGSTFILGDSKPTLTQTSHNTLSNEQEIGGGGTTTLIATGANACFCQSSSQGTNSKQVGVNGSGGGAGTTAIIGNSAPALTQVSTNIVGNGQYIGGSATAGADTIIGSTAQAGTQGVNSTQSGKNGDGAGGTLFVGGPAGSAPALTQNSCNDLATETVLGSGSGNFAPRCGQRRSVG